MDSQLRHNGVIVIRPPILRREGECAQSSRFHTAFNLLGTAKRASLVGNLGDDAGEFSKPVTGGGVWNKDEGFAALYLKAPGTDIYLPRELAQFEHAVRKIIDHNYISTQTGPQNRDGSEWVHLIVSQRMEYPIDFDKLGVAQTHLDLNVHDVVEQGGWFKDERYVISDTEKMGTIFLDADTGLQKHDLLPLGKAYWDNKLKAIFDERATTAKKLAPHDIVHFDSTTPHARENPECPVLRTFLTLGIGHGYVPLDLSRIGNSYLLEAMERQKERATPKMRSEPMMA